MLFVAAYLAVFWRLPWSAPLREALRFAPKDARLGWCPQPIPAAPDASPIAPNWLRPLCVQRWVGQAVLARAAWLHEHPESVMFRFGNESDPCWSRTAQLAYDRASLRALSEEGLRWLFGAEVERLLRLTRTNPALLGQCAWVAALLGASEHVTQLYHEPRRRYRAGRARAIVREELGCFVAAQANGSYQARVEG